MKQREAQLAKAKDEVAQGAAERKRLHDRVASLNQEVCSLQQLNTQVSPCMVRLTKPWRSLTCSG